MRKLNLAFVSLITIAGCSQVLGLGDYDIDPALDGKGGSSIGAGGTQGDAGADSTPSSGAPQVPAGGEPNLPVGGQGGQGGQGGESTGQAGMGGAPPLEVVPCDSIDCCKDKGGTPVGVELLTDGSFELGPASEGLSPWFEESTNALDVVTNDPDLGFEPKSGSYYSYLSGLQGERSSIYSEDVVVPEDAGWITLSGYRLFQVDVQDEVNEDFALIAFYDPEEKDPVELPFWWGNPVEHPDGWGDTPIWKKFEATWDAAPHQGMKRYLGLRGESDSYPLEPAEIPEEDDTTYASSYLFDDVSLKIFTCVK
ncbi:MAG: hypothetical protein EOO73_17785 [Myxococcales bacterium]|nr:MAG: hypothetical protein EOO73_17785 [Myxococcales bacterium]